MIALTWLSDFGKSMGFDSTLVTGGKDDSECTGGGSVSVGVDGS